MAKVIAMNVVIIINIDFDFANTIQIQRTAEMKNLPHF